MKRVFYTVLLVLLSLTAVQTVFSQAGVLDPTDPDQIFTSNNQPPAPTWGVISKWGHTNRLAWNPYSYGYKSYIFHGMAFRLKFPKSYQDGVADGKKYPVFIFLHGLGEFAPIYDNELQLVHGGQIHAQKVNDDTFDGFLLYPQSTSGYLTGNMGNVTALLDSMIKYVKADRDRVILSGLSSGGQSDWTYLEQHPEIYASAAIISAADAEAEAAVPSLLSIPMWLTNGGKDRAPTPATVQFVVDKYVELGGEIRHTLFPDQGHSVWNSFWNTPGYFDYLNAAHKAQPVVLFQHNEFCPNDPVHAEMILQPGFYQYEWQKNDTTLAGATGSSYTATEYGSYRARFKRKSTSDWSDWSPRPIVVSVKEGTLPPPIQVDGLHSIVLPAPDSSTTVPLKVPDTYASYDWRNVSNNTLVSTTNTLDAPVGQFKVQVTEQYGCSSSYSDPFTVVPADGANAPDKATDLTAITLSNTSIELFWNQNPTAINNETAFEVYRSTTSGTYYKLIGILPTDASSYNDDGLQPDVKYYYIVRAVNENGAAPLSNEASDKTKSDQTPPDAPQGLTVTTTTRHTVSLSWEDAHDDVGVVKYDLYINGVKAYTTDQTQFTVNNLDSFTSYSFYVRALDFSGNMSVPGRQVSGFTKFAGLNYKLYTGSWNVLPDFDTLTPVQTGTTDIVDISVSPYADNFGMLWQGYLRIPVSGTYTFYIASDDGSKFYFNKDYSNEATATIDNDGLHGTVEKSVSMYVTAGMYPIAVTFFEKTGGQSMTLSWKNSDAGFSSKTEIPTAYFGDSDTPTGTLPAFPSGLLAVPVAYNKVQLTWMDNSTNETGFEIYRKGGGETSYDMIGLVPANTTTFDDTLVTGSTRYSYAIQAVNKYGTSGYNPDDLGGVKYNYYEGNWNKLPDFNDLTPVSTGILENFSIVPRLSEDYFAFKFSGIINIPADGVYTFYTKSDDGSKLYIDTFDNNGQVVNNDFTQGATERSGDVTLTAGPHPIFVTYFEKISTQFLEVSWKGPGIAKQVIPNEVLENTNTTVTTPPLPAIPDVPEMVSLESLSAKEVVLIFKDTSTQTGYEIFRAMNDSSNFRLYKILETSDDSVVVYDTTLYANTKYYYKVRALGIAGASAFSEMDSVITLNTVPVIVPIISRGIYYAGPVTIPVQATDKDGDQMTFTLNGLPAFGSFTNTANGSGEIVLAPSSSADMGVYTITVNVNDGHDGKDSTVFDLIVTSNRLPVLGRLKGITVAEGATNLTDLYATDLDRYTTLVYRMVDGPAFAHLRIDADRKAFLYLSPGYADAGSYTIRLNVADGNGGIDSIEVPVTVTDVAPRAQIIYASILNSGNTPAGAPWNNISMVTTTELLDSQEEPTTVGIDFLTYLWKTSNAGAVTNNNSGIYPDDVIRDYYYFGNYGVPDSLQFTITGLDTTGKYTVDLFGSSTFSSGATNYIVDGQTKSLEVGNNSQNIVSFKGLAPDTSGNILVTMAKANGVSVGYLNSIVIVKQFDDGTKPTDPSDFAAIPLPNGSVLLKWKDIAYNEEGYTLMKSTSPDNGYAIINPGMNNTNDSTYVDSNSAGNHTYYYKLFAHNQHGSSDTLGPVGVTLTNRVPQLQKISSVYTRSGQVTDLNLTATDDAGETLVFTTVGLPSFATLQNNGDGTATIHIAPQNGEEGFYKNIDVKVEDNYGGYTMDQFSVSVSNDAYRTVYLNLGPGGSSPEPAPWNNFLSYPYGGGQVVNMNDDANQPTGYTFTLNNQLSTTSNYGMTDNNNGIYPDNVLATSIVTSSTEAATFQFTNLDQSKKYNVAILCNLNAGSVDSGTFSSGGQTVSINGAYNTTRTVQLNGLSPDGSGKIVVTFAKSANSEFLNLNAVVLQEYTGSPILAPGDLFTQTTLTTSEVKMTWSDRSSDETGFQIWRSTAPQSGFVMAGTASANATSYTDNDASLVPGMVYYYKVRAKRGTEYSPFSNVSRFGLAANVVLLNFNAKLENHEPLPWNNTDDGPSLEGLIVDNLTNTNIQNTGFLMEITKHFNGVGYAGVSGAFPDHVITTDYWTDAAMVSEFKFANLDQRKKYRIGILASVNRSGYYFGRYTINGVTKEVNNYINSFKVIYFDNISPDENGEIYVSVTPNEASAYCFTNAIMLENYENTGDSGNGVQRGGQAGNLTSGISNSEAISTTVNQPGSNVPDNIPEVLSVQAYPNPFTTHLQVQIKGLKTVGATVEMFDMKSNLVYHTVIPAGGMQGGTRTIKIPVAQSLPAGTYILKIYNQDNQLSSTKLIKVR